MTESASAPPARRYSHAGATWLCLEAARPRWVALWFGEKRVC